MIGVPLAGRIIIADEVAVAIDTADGVDVGRAVADVAVDVGGRRGLGHAAPVVVAVLVINAVFVRVLDGVPLELYAVAGAGDIAEYGRVDMDGRVEAEDAVALAGASARVGEGVDGVILGDALAVAPLYRVVGAAAVHSLGVGVEVAVIGARTAARPKLTRGGRALLAEAAVTVAVEDDGALALIPVIIAVGMVKRRLCLCLAVEDHVFGAELGTLAARGGVDLQLDQVGLGDLGDPQTSAVADGVDVAVAVSLTGAVPVDPVLGAVAVEDGVVVVACAVQPHQIALFQYAGIIGVVDGVEPDAVDVVGVP